MFLYAISGWIASLVVYLVMQRWINHYRERVDELLEANIAQREYVHELKKQHAVDLREAEAVSCRLRETTETLNRLQLEQHDLRQERSELQRRHQALLAELQRLGTDGDPE